MRGKGKSQRMPPCFGLASWIYITAIMIALFSARPAHADPWPTYHGSYALTGVSPDAFTAAPERVWRTRVGRELPSAVVGDDERLFCIADGESVVALDASGAQLWTKTVISAAESRELQLELFEAPPLYMGSDTLVVAGTSGHAYGLSAKDGAQKWAYAAGERIQGTPNYAPGRIFLMTQQSGALHAVNPVDGARLWTGDPLDRCDAHIAVSGGHVVFGNCTAAFHSFDPVSGKRGMSIDVGEGGEMAGGVALSGGHAFGGNRGGVMVCVDLEAGKVLWRNQDSKGELFTTPAVTDSRVVFCGGDAIVYCVDRVTGKTIWTYDTAGREPKSPVIAAAGVIAVTDGTLYGLSLADGALLWKREVSDEITDPAVVDGRIIVGVDDGHIVAYGAGLRSSANND
jgi:outer membrane protein assembly factor BamB